MKRKHWLRTGLLALLLAINGCSMMGDHMSGPAPTHDGSKGDGGGGGGGY